ncbi:ATP-binding cassette domain-containing protein [Dactylosporangium sp. NPDC049742]|uniref:ATP-binding cassette domain-containing protein n=1 Tax=Dactylosporangium sp. NPDC049742 TaxID=3154737 RepID=UPI0034473102
MYAIRISGLVKRHVIAGVDLSVPPGALVAVLGPPGAGKSALVEIVLGLTGPDAGEVSIHDRPPRDAVRAGRVGAMLQHGTLLDDCSVHETAAMIASLHRSARPVTEALDLAGVRALAGRRCGTLSPGERRQVRYALALAGCPDVVVLDEPPAFRGFHESLRVLGRRGTAVLVTARSLPDAVFDQVVALPAAAIA